MGIVTKLAFILLYAFSISSAQAKSVTVMINMNYSSTELVALEEVAQKQGQEVIMIPPRSLIPLAEPMFLKKMALEKRIQELRPNWSSREVRIAIYDFAREGSNYSKDPQLKAALAGDIQEYYEMSKRVDEKEKELGPLHEQIAKVAKDLKQKGVTVDTMVISAHSDGTNLSSETSTRVSSGDILRLQANHPEFFRNARHALLLGCYNMTDFNRKKWRHNLFPNASLMAGFGVRAPSRFRPISAQYIKDTLNTANALDDKLSSNRPISLKEINDSFKKLSSVLNTQSVIDYCYSIIEGQPGAAKLECDEQWDTFLGAAEVIEKEYLDLSKPLKEPPIEDANNELRDFYNLLQNTCPAEQTKKYNDRGVAAAERYRSSLKSTTIRMMHWWDIQKNFQSYYRYEIAELTKELKEVGFKIAIPKLDGRASRADFVYAYDTIERIIYKRRRDLEELYYYGRNMSSEKKRKVERDLNIFQNLERKFSIYASLYALKGDVDGHEESGASEIENTLARGEIPFNWISGGAVLRPRRDQ